MRSRFDHLLLIFILSGHCCCSSVVRSTGDSDADGGDVSQEDGAATLEDLDALLEKESKTLPHMSPLQRSGLGSDTERMATDSSYSSSAATTAAAAPLSVKALKVELMRAGVSPTKLNNFLDRESLSDYFENHNRGRTAAAVRARMKKEASSSSASTTTNAPLTQNTPHTGGGDSQSQGGTGEEDSGDNYDYPGLPPIPPKSQRPKTRTSVQAPVSSDTTRFLNAAGIIGDRHHLGTAAASSSKSSSSASSAFGSVNLPLSGLSSMFDGSGGGGVGNGTSVTPPGEAAVTGGIVTRSIKQVVLLGERHSGLGWVAKLLRLNCPHWKLIEPKGLARHALLKTSSGGAQNSGGIENADADDDDDVFGFEGANETLVLLVVKDPFTWVATMHDRSPTSISRTGSGGTAHGLLDDDISGAAGKKTKKKTKRVGKVTNPKHPDFNPEEEESPSPGGKKSHRRHRKDKNRLGVSPEALELRKLKKKKHMWNRPASTKEKVALERFVRSPWNDHESVGDSGYNAAASVASRSGVSSSSGSSSSGGGGEGYGSVVKMRTAKLEALFDALDYHEQQAAAAAAAKNKNTYTQTAELPTSTTDSLSTSSSLLSSSSSPSPFSGVAFTAVMLFIL